MNVSAIAASSERNCNSGSTGPGCAFSKAASWARSIREAASKRRSGSVSSLYTGGTRVRSCSRVARVRSALSNSNEAWAETRVVAIWLGSSGASSVVSPAELMTTIAATVTRKMRNATRRLLSRKSPIAECASGRAERLAPRPPSRSRSWLRTDMAQDWPASGVPRVIGLR